MTDQIQPGGAIAAYVGLGANLGDPEAALEAARKGLDALQGVTLGALSPLYRSEPVGYADQPVFLNQAARLDCDASVRPEDLLDSLLELEHILGRRRDPAIRFGPRAIDLDLLLFGNTRMNSPRLTLPHPRMLERAFVLVPLADIAGDLVLPDGRTVIEALGNLRVEICDGILRQT